MCCCVGVCVCVSVNGGTFCFACTMCFRVAEDVTSECWGLWIYQAQKKHIDVCRQKKPGRGRMERLVRRRKLEFCFDSLRKSTHSSFPSLWPWTIQQRLFICQRWRRLCWLLIWTFPQFWFNNIKTTRKSDRTRRRRWSVKTDFKKLLKLKTSKHSVQIKHRV